MMKNYQIALHGCDDSTYIKMQLSEEQYNLVKILCEKSEENSEYACMPVMEIEKER